MKRTAAFALLALVAALAFAPAAMAADGVGLWGRTTDQVITNWAFAVIALFILLPIVLSILQHKLETRKERAREQLDRINRP